MAVPPEPLFNWIIVQTSFAAGIAASIATYGMLTYTFRGVEFSEDRNENQVLVRRKDAFIRYAVAFTFFLAFTFIFCILYSIL